MAPCPIADVERGAARGPVGGYLRVPRDGGAITGV